MNPASRSLVSSTSEVHNYHVNASMTAASEKRLLVSIHDVGPRFDREVEQLVEMLSALLGGANFAMLVVPNHWGTHPISNDRPFQRRLRQWSDDGVEMFVHGWFHRDTFSHGGTAAIKARFMTAGEGEFLGLPEDDAGQRMAKGKILVEDIIGRPVTGFIAPAWLYSAGALAALKNSGFALAEDHFRVWRPSDGRRLAFGPVITWASRSRFRTASSIAFAGIARTALHSLETVRVGVHPGDVTKEALLASITATVNSFARTRMVGRYADLLG